MAILAAGETAMFLLLSKKKFPDKKIEKILKNPYLLLNTVLLSNNFFCILFSNITEEFFDKKVFYFIGSQEIKILVVIFATTLLVLIFGEVLPKNFALQYPEKVAKVTVYPFALLKKIFFPFSYLFYKLSKVLTNLIGDSDHSGFTHNEIRQIISLSHEKGVLNKDEKTLIQTIINFSHTEIRNLMIPRKDLLAVSDTELLGKVWRLMKENNASKILVYKNTIDNIVGFIHLKDILTRQDEFNLNIKNIRNILREAHFVPESKKPAQCLKIMRQKKVSFIVVLDEYGGTSGIVTLNQMMKSIMGSSLEENTGKKYWSEINPKEIIVSGNYFRLREVKDFFKLEEDIADGEERVGAFLLEKMDRQPEAGDKTKLMGLDWEILEMKENSINRLRIKKTV